MRPACCWSARPSALREQFIAVLGHDLRNPLTAILGGMEMLRKNPLNDRATQWAEMVVASASRMAEMIDVVMDFSRSRLGGGIPIDCAECDSLELVLRQLVTQLKSSRPSLAIQSQFGITAPVYCDLRRITQLAANLLGKRHQLRRPGPADPYPGGNAGWLVRAGGRQCRRARSPRRCWRTIFEPFSRGTVQPSREGLGLGLYISYQIAQAHGGTLCVSSTPAETRFCFRMPLEQAL